MRRIVIELSDKEVEIGKGIHMTLVEQASPSEEELCRKVIQEVKRQCDMPEQLEHRPCLNKASINDKGLKEIMFKLSDLDINEVNAARCVKHGHPIVNILLDEIIRQTKEYPQQKFISIEPEVKTIKDMEVLQELVDELKRQAEPDKGVTVEVYEKDDRPDACRYAYVAERLINKHKEDANMKKSGKKYDKSDKRRAKAKLQQVTVLMSRVHATMSNMAVYPDMYASLQALYCQGKYTMVSNVCDAILNSAVDF